MPLSFLGDENLPGRFFRASARHNAGGNPHIDLIRVGDVADLPLGSSDFVILQWIETNGRILLTLDERSMPEHLSQHLAAGRHVPGIFSIHPTARMPDVVEYLVLVANASEESEWRDQLRYIP